MFDGVLTLAHNGPVALSCPNSGNSTKGSPYSPQQGVRAIRRRQVASLHFLLLLVPEPGIVRIFLLPGSQLHEKRLVRPPGPDMHSPGHEFQSGVIPAFRREIDVAVAVFRRVVPKELIRIPT